MVVVYSFLINNFIFQYTSTNILKDVVKFRSHFRRNYYITILSYCIELSIYIEKITKSKGPPLQEARFNLCGRTLSVVFSTRFLELSLCKLFDVTPFLLALLWLSHFVPSFNWTDSKWNSQLTLSTLILLVVISFYAPNKCFRSSPQPWRDIGCFGSAGSLLAPRGCTSRYCGWTKGNGLRQLHDRTWGIWWRTGG